MRRRLAIALTVLACVAVLPLLTGFAKGEQAFRAPSTSAWTRR